MTHIVCVSCTKNKRNKPAPAKDLYDTSRYFRSQRKYAQLKGDKWFILSAKHGLLKPEEHIEPYNTYLPDQDTNYVEEWASNVVSSLLEFEPHTVTFTAGSTYTDPVIPELERHGIECLEPLRGLEIGERMSRLRELANGLENHELDV